MADTYGSKPTDPGYLDPKYRSFSEQWKAEDTRCTSCNRPLHNPWFWRRWHFGNLTHASHAAKRREWSAALHWLRSFDLRGLVKGVR